MRANFLVLLALPRSPAARRPRARRRRRARPLAGLGQDHRLQRFPRRSRAAAPGGRRRRRRTAEAVRVPAGGAAYLASAIAQLRAGNPNSVVVSAGDMISASPLVSAVFLDEPTILAMNLIGVDLQRGRQSRIRPRPRRAAAHAERRLRASTRCASPAGSSRLPGRQLHAILAANVVTENGDTLFPAYAIRSFGSGAQRGEGRLHRPDPRRHADPGHARRASPGLSFRDEAETINALVPRLKAEGADAIVVLIHQGLSTPRSAITTRAARASTAICCRSSPGSIRRSTWSSPATPTMPISATMAGSIRRGRSSSPAPGSYGTLLTDIDLTIDPAPDRVIAKRADNLIVQGEAYTGASRPGRRSPISSRATRADPAVAALVDRYVAAAAPLANRSRRPAERAGAARRRRRPASGARQPHRRRPSRRDQRARRRRRADRLHQPDRRPRRHRPGRRRRRHLRPALRRPALRQQSGRQELHRPPDPGPARAAIRQRHQHASTSPIMLLPSRRLPTYAYDLTPPGGAAHRRGSALNGAPLARRRRSTG